MHLNEEALLAVIRDMRVESRDRNLAAAKSRSTVARPRLPFRAGPPFFPLAPREARGRGWRPDTVRAPGEGLPPCRERRRSRAAPRTAAALRHQRITGIRHRSRRKHWPRRRRPSTSSPSAKASSTACFRKPSSPPAAVPLQLPERHQHRPAGLEPAQESARPRARPQPPPADLGRGHHVGRPSPRPELTDPDPPDT